MYYAPHGLTAQLGYYRESGTVHDRGPNPAPARDYTLHSLNLWLTQRLDVSVCLAEVRLVHLHDEGQVNVRAIIVVVAQCYITVRPVADFDGTAHQVAVVLQTDWRIPILSCPRIISLALDVPLLLKQPSVPIEMHGMTLQGPDFH